jgi:starch-binding outer membrane protein, SusD/RagB family
MKNKIKISILTASLIAASTVYSCKEEFLDRKPLGAIAETSLSNAAGVNGSLIQAYRTLTGANVAAWYTNAYNWVFGSVRSEEAYKGSEASDQGDLNPIERYEVLPGNPVLTNKWSSVYDGIGMANATLRLLPLAKDLTADQALQIEAEAKFIRGFHHFEGKRNFNKVPYVDETITTTEQFQALKNDGDIYPQIEADLKFAFDNLTPTKSEKGRVNKWAAGAFLAKAYLYQKKYTEAKALFDNLIANGVTSAGEKYGLLDKFSDVFKGDFENSKEVIFGIQMTVGDGTGGNNGNLESELPNPHNDGPGGCCGFFQPSQSLANLFRNTPAGLPIATTGGDPHATPALNHESNAATAPDRGTFDPRFDHTVGRVGIQFLDWGLAKSSWIRNMPNGGPWMPKKNIFYQTERGKYQTAGGWGQSRTGKNVLVMRFADLLLMAAECEVEVGSLATATSYVNMIRTRAANAADFVNVGGVPEAAYVIANYATFPDKPTATAAIRHERLIELAMEGHRFYDLVRWGTADAVLDAFVARESSKRTHLAGASFDAPTDLYLPIPESVISQSKGNLTQN